MNKDGSTNPPKEHSDTLRLDCEEGETNRTPENQVKRMTARLLQDTEKQLHEITKSTHAWKILQRERYTEEKSEILEMWYLVGQAKNTVESLNNRLGDAEEKYIQGENLNQAEKNKKNKEQNKKTKKVFRNMDVNNQIYVS